MEPNICGATYERRLAGKVFVCTIKPHPNKPDAHRYEASDRLPAQPKHGRLVVFPGQRGDR